MSRRFQFSVRALLVASVAMCVVLGSWRLHRTAQFVEAIVLAPDQPVLIRGRLIWLFGPKSIDYALFVRAPHEMSILHPTAQGTVNRSMLGVYDVAVQIPPRERCGTHQLNLASYDSLVWPGGEDEPFLTVKTTGSMTVPSRRKGEDLERLKPEICLEE